MHDEVVNLTQLVEIAGVAETGMERHQNAMVFGPRFGELPTMERAGSVEEDERRGVRITGREDDCLGAIDVERQRSRARASCGRLHNT